MVMDNQTARIRAGARSTIPVPTQAVSTLTAGAPIVNSIEFRDTGVILEVTPHINRAGRWCPRHQAGSERRRHDHQLGDQHARRPAASGSPTQVAVEEPISEIALGGLIRNSKTDTRSGIPFLMDLPLLGPLFRTTTDSKSRSRTDRAAHAEGHPRQLGRLPCHADLKRRLHNVAPPLAPEPVMVTPSPRATCRRRPHRRRCRCSRWTRSAGFVVRRPTKSSAPPTVIAPLPPTPRRWASAAVTRRAMGM